MPEFTDRGFLRGDPLRRRRTQTLELGAGSCVGHCEPACPSEGGTQDGSGLQGRVPGAGLGGPGWVSGSLWFGRSFLRIHGGSTVGLQGAGLGAVCPGPSGLAGLCLGPMQSLQGGRDTFVSARQFWESGKFGNPGARREHLGSVKQGGEGRVTPAPPSRTLAGVTRSHAMSCVYKHGAQPASCNPKTFQMHKVITAVHPSRTQPHPGTAAMGSELPFSVEWEGGGCGGSGKRPPPHTSCLSEGLHVNSCL